MRFGSSVTVPTVKSRQTAGEAEEEIKHSALYILAGAFSCPVQMLKVVGNFLTFMQPYRLLAFGTESSPFIPGQCLICRSFLAVAGP